MEVSNVLYDSKNLLRDLKVENSVDLQVENVKNEFNNIVSNIIDKGANYIIKAMPVNDHIKDILIDVKKAFKTKDFKNIISTAVNSSIREGLEVLNLPKNTIKDIANIKNVVMKGGLAEGLAAGIEVVLKNYTKNGLFSDITKDFIDKLKGFVENKAFINKIDQSLNKAQNRVERFKNKCDEWYKAYSDFDLSKINEIAQNLSAKVRNVKYDEDSMKANATIQNLTEFVNRKKDKLSEMQFRACSLL